MASEVILIMTPERRAIETVLQVLSNKDNAYSRREIADQIHGATLISLSVGVYSDDLHYIYQTAANLAREELRRAV